MLEMEGIKDTLNRLTGRGIMEALRIKDGVISRHCTRKLDKIRLHRTTAFMGQGMFELYRLKGRSIRPLRPLLPISTNNSQTVVTSSNSRSMALVVPEWTQLAGLSTISIESICKIRTRYHRLTPSAKRFREMRLSSSDF